jgi:hypothetical protein
MADLVSSLLSGVSNAFQGTAPANVNTSQTTTTQAPAEYLQYLSTLGNVGMSQMNAPASSMVAPLSTLQNQVYGTEAGQANTANLLTSALAPLQTAAQTVDSSQINNYLNPYVTDVNKALETNTQQNINNTILPALQSIGASTGNTGSSRLANATGQTLANIQQGLGSQESSNLATAYQNALQGALTEQSQLGNIGTQGMNATTSGLNTAASLGAQNQAQQQAIINAPLQTATTAAGLVKGLTIPTSTTQTYTGPASSYGPSPLSQIASLASLFASPSGGTSAAEGISNAWNKVFGSGSPIDMTGVQTGTTTPVTYPSTPDTTSTLGSGNYTNTSGSPTVANANSTFGDNTLGSGNFDTTTLNNQWGSTLLGGSST